jgi:hypothetical protein
MSWLRQRPYLTLLVTLVLLLGSYPVLGRSAGTRLLSQVLLTVAFLVSFPVIFKRGVPRLVGVFLAVPTLIGAWTGYVLPGLPELAFAEILHLFAALFFGLAVGLILWESYQRVTVTPDGLIGAFCSYLLAALAFAHIYSLCESLAPGSFSGSPGLMEEMHGEARRHFLLTYFSFITLTTVGYGDITPGSDATRGFAVLEAVLGQFYIAVLIAEFIRKQGTSTAPGNSPSRGE